MPLMLKHSINSVVRSPWKSLLFVLLLSAAILFVSLGSSMLYSAERMLAQADEQFSTVVSLKYGGLENINGAWDDKVFQENIARLDLAPILDHPSVLAVDTEREIFAFAENGREVKQHASPFYDIVIFTFSPAYQEDEVSWTAPVRYPHPGKEDPQIISHFHHGRNRGPGIAGYRLLLDGDGRAEPADIVHFRFFHLGDKLPGKGGEQLHITPLTIRVRRIERQGGFSAAGDSG